MDLGLTGLKAVLAGASKGIGLATAEALAKEGCDVAICARGQGDLANAAAKLGAAGVKVFTDSVDLADAAAYAAWVGQAGEKLGGIDIFICFATASGGPASEEKWKANFELDLMAVWRGAQAALPLLEKSKAGSIVAISTTAALEESFGPQPYNAMKAALINYAAALSQQLAPKGVRVNTVSPGPIYFEGGVWDRIKTKMTDFYDATVKSVPMGRLGSDVEVAKAIAFVASPACRFMTGTNLVIDGGLTRRVQY
ncbi:MAG: SDR family oxidoreductase [Rhodospirillales bacterium]|nr:SDR family oxidoreductase [Rhodospirillales bacterium]